MDVDDLALILYKNDIQCILKMNIFLFNWALILYKNDIQ